MKQSSATPGRPKRRFPVGCSPGGVPSRHTRPDEDGPLLRTCEARVLQRNLRCSEWQICRYEIIALNFFKTNYIIEFIIYYYQLLILCSGFTKKYSWWQLLVTWLQKITSIGSSAWFVVGQKGLVPSCFVQWVGLKDQTINMMCTHAVVFTAIWKIT